MKAASSVLSTKMNHNDENIRTRSKLNLGHFLAWSPLAIPRRKPEVFAVRGKEIELRYHGYPIPFPRSENGHENEKG